MSHLWNKIPFYSNVPRLRRDIEMLLSIHNSLKPNVDEFISPTGQKLTRFFLHGTLPILYNGRSYNIPVTIFFDPPYPSQSPRCFVTPTKTMAITPNHPHIDAKGMIYIPYLSSWNPYQSTLPQLIQVIIQVFSKAPPVYSTDSSTSLPSRESTAHPPTPSSSTTSHAHPPSLYSNPSPSPQYTNYPQSQSPYANPGGSYANPSPPSFVNPSLSQSFSNHSPSPNYPSQPSYGNYNGVPSYTGRASAAPGAYPAGGNYGGQLSPTYGAGGGRSSQFVPSGSPVSPSSASTVSVYGSSGPMSPAEEENLTKRRQIRERLLPLFRSKISQLVKNIETEKQRKRELLETEKKRQNFNEKLTKSVKLMQEDLDEKNILKTNCQNQILQMSHKSPLLSDLILYNDQNFSQQIFYLNAKLLACNDFMDQIDELDHQRVSLSDFVSTIRDVAKEQFMTKKLLEKTISLQKKRNNISRENTVA